MIKLMHKENQTSACLLYRGHFMEFLKAHQLNVMLFLSGICGVLVVLALMSRTLSPKRRRILAHIETAGMLLLLADRYAYLYRGNTGISGFWMVRITNFLVYFLSLYITHSVSLYYTDLLENEGGMTKRPLLIYICEWLFTAGIILLIISQFTGLYYTFDSKNQYVRSPGSLISYVIPISIIILQMTLVLHYKHTLSRTITSSLFLNSAIILIAAILQHFFYGLSLINISMVSGAILLYLFVLIDLNDKVEHAKIQEIEFYKKEHEQEHELFEQTALALASAIDAKDKYTHGHSSRVALYSAQIAKEAGKSEEECEMIYFAALLHDVGKIGIPDSIINKDGKLTDEEFAQIKMHPVYGNEILSRIRRSPYLSIGAHYHHERYDGRGYPDGLKGDDIPEIARIVGVADAYDAMTSKRSYRDPIPQDKVREELVKGMGTQFDPEFAKIMQHLIDLDTEYNMKEQLAGTNLSERSSFDSKELFDDYSSGILINENLTRLSFSSRPINGNRAECLPVLVLFDSLDGRYQDTEDKKRDLVYLEYGKIYMNGQTECEAARKIEVRPSSQSRSSKNGRNSKSQHYLIEAVRIEDHLMLNISDGEFTGQIIVALPDSTRFSYISITGKNCRISGISVDQTGEPVSPDFIPRIAEKISYIKDSPAGDIPNVQVDRWRSSSSEAIPISGDMKLTFHAMSLPTARLIWHCPYISIFSSENARTDSESYKEYVLVRLDGENWESDDGSENRITTTQTPSFVGWHNWKKLFKAGVDCEVMIKKNGSQISVSTENLGVVVESLTTILEQTENLYIALTGDQVALTNIRIEKL